MRNFLVLILSVFSFALYAQGPGGLINVATPLNEISTNQVSPANAYFGSSIQSVVTGDNLSDNFLFEANFIYSLPIKSSWNFPVISTAALPFAGGSLDNIEVGVYPWTVFSSTDNASWIFHCGVDGNLSLVPGQDAAGTPQSVRVLTGIEGAFNVPNAMPVTLGISPIYNVNNLDRDNYFLLEASLLAPLTKGLGVLVEYQHPFIEAIESQINIGVLVLSPLGN